MASDIVERLRDKAYVEVNPFLCSTVAANEIERLRAKLAEYEGMPVRLRHIGTLNEYEQGVHDRLRHILKTGRMPDEDDPR